jgi:hypothetical protein
MIVAAGARLTDLIVAAPAAFLLGLVVGLGASSRWLIVRRERDDR